MKSFSDIIKNNSGVAILMILASVTILTAVLADFTFNTNVNKIKVYNIQDQAQSRLNAESGLKLGLARLRLYQEAFNIYKKNKDAQKIIKLEDLNQIWQLPFVFPIPKSDKMNLIQKSTVDEFMENMLLDGELRVEVQNASNKVNLNLLRISHLAKQEQQRSNQGQSPSNSTNDPNDQIDEEFKVDMQLQKMLERVFEAKNEADEQGFLDRQGLKEPEKLVAALKHFISDRESYDNPYITEFEAAYQQAGIEPKYAPFVSLSEVLLVDGWDQELLSTIENNITVHGSVFIDLNKINKGTLKLLLPNLEEEQIEEFFKYRDNPEDPNYFNDVKSFRTYVVDSANFMDGDEFDNRMKKFEQAGLKFGVSGSLFKIISTGKYRRAQTSIHAFVSMPAKPEPTPSVSPTPKSNNSTSTTTTTSTTPTATPTASPTGSPTPPPLQFFRPRVIELQLK